jgi:hypothetical protein
MSQNANLRIGLVWRGDPHAAEQPVGRNNLLQPLFDAFAELDVAPESVVFAEDVADQVREQLLRCDGALVWVNPIQDGLDRTVLNEILRDVASKGVWVSANPDVIATMGTKEVLYRTRELGWGMDTDLYANADEFRARFPTRLASGKPRVLKQDRGNGGNGVWKIELASADGSSAGPGTEVFVDHAMQSAGSPKRMTLGEFMSRCEDYFADSGRIVDQPFQERLGEGMIRCYFVHDEVVGFCHQWPKGLLPRTASSEETSAPPQVRPVMEDPSTPAYQVLKASVESAWIPQMKETLGIASSSLPVIWDADFLYGPKNESGGDTYVLCEINVSAVWPYPEQATEKLARAALARLSAAKPTRPS